MGCASKSRWLYTGLVLIVEILESGRSGHLYLVSNYWTQTEESESDSWWSPLDKNCEKLPPMLQGKPSFTLAKVEEEDLALLDDVNPASEKKEITLRAVSTSTVEVVQTGTVHPASKVPIALWPLDEQEHV